MPTYDFCYLNEDGGLACTLAASFPDATRAKVFAHAMKLSHTKTFEVWLGDDLVYARPSPIGDEHLRLAS